MSAHIFISYSSKDKIRTEAVLKDLESSGFTCWIAPRDIEPGHSYGSDIVHAIANATVVLLIFSESSQQSPWVLKEIERAISKGIPIIPFRIENCIPTGEMEFFISNTQWIDAFDYHWDAAVTTLKTTIQPKLNPVIPVARKESANPSNSDPAQTVKKGKEKVQMPTPHTSAPNTLTDIDGNVYKTVKIGNQIWTAENLKVTKLNDGTPIRNITDDKSWASIKLPAFCFYDNDPANKDKYGALYNFFAVDTGLLAPKGWHVPTDEEWEILIKSLGGAGKAGKLLKSKTGWEDNGNGTDAVGFGALPGGYLHYRNGNFDHLGRRGFWWSSSADGAGAWYRYIVYEFIHFLHRHFDNQRNGISVRLVQN